jgi:hypothetical protein
MFVEQIRKRLQEKFRPFIVRLSDGRQFLVAHPQFIAVSPQTGGLIDQDGFGHWVNPLPIVSIDDTASASQDA